MYTVAAALAVRGRGRVLAFEPNPAAREQLQANLVLNHCEETVVVAASAAADAPGETLLHVPVTADPSFSSLETGRFEEAEPVAVPVTTVDEEVAVHDLRPRVVKIDVEGGELRVLAGMERTLEARPALIVEVGPETAGEAEATLRGRGYGAHRVERGKLRPGLENAPGLFNAVFLAR
jgi:FkbM family methyltransferase